MLCSSGLSQVAQPIGNLIFLFCMEIFTTVGLQTSGRGENNVKNCQKLSNMVKMAKNIDYLIISYLKASLSTLIRYTML